MRRRPMCLLLLLGCLAFWAALFWGLVSALGAR